LEHWRLQSGFPPGPGELNGETNPLELGLVAQISTEKGCYLGQETMAKLIGQAGVKQQLRCWSCPSPLAASTKLTLDGERAGVITSALECDGTWLGLALVRRQCLASPTLEGPNREQLQIRKPWAFQDPDA
jgi:folate-binding protein YgfZ